MRYTSVPAETCCLTDAHPFCVDHALSVLGLRQRESLCRGIAFFFVLAASCLVLIYAPLAWSGADASTGSGQARRPASQPAFAGRDRTATTR